MQLGRSLGTYGLIFALIVLVACGSGESLVSISVTPGNAVVSSVSPENSVQFTAMGNYEPSYCGNGQYAPPCTVDHMQVLKNATWSTSDSTNTSVDSKGLATCLSPTPTPAKILASAQGINGLVSGKAALTCN